MVDTTVNGTWIGRGSTMEKIPERIHTVSIGLDKDRFLRQLLGYLAESLQEVTGMDQAEGFISLVGQKIGDELNGHYLQSLNLTTLDRFQIPAVLVDLKRRIDGDFYLIHADERQLVLGNRRCPFGDKVIGRPALCMMTSNVFGVIAAENAGYGRVDIQKSIANGDGHCHVVISLEASETGAGREYFRSGE